ncbi:hypothetical protein ACN60_10890 [Escherichia coli]|nr:hypothetical protein ACN60_10890 [Escherichia coli]
MEQILPWQNMVEVIEPFYPKAGNGRRPYPLETMLRIHCMQHWYNLSDGAMEDALYEIASMRLFALSAGNHATHSLHAALVQPERWRDGRCSVRNRLHASVCPVIPG